MRRAIAFALTVLRLRRCCRSEKLPISTPAICRARHQQLAVERAVEREGIE
jgi:hypothetical protein